MEIVRIREAFNYVRDEYPQWCGEFLPLDVNGVKRRYHIFQEFCEPTHLVDPARTVVDVLNRRFDLAFVCPEQDIPSFFLLDIAMFVTGALWTEIVQSGITGFQAEPVKTTFPDSR